MVFSSTISGYICLCLVYGAYFWFIFEQRCFWVYSMALLCSSFGFMENKWFHSQYLHTHFSIWNDINCCCCCPGFFYDDHLFNWCICFASWRAIFYPIYSRLRFCGWFIQPWESRHIYTHTHTSAPISRTRMSSMAQSIRIWCARFNIFIANVVLFLCFLRSAW